jgi:hypothetical protein
MDRGGKYTLVKAKLHLSALQLEVWVPLTASRTLFSEAFDSSECQNCGNGSVMIEITSAKTITPFL